jgi:uncharacterized delta-60 repeat protein
MTLFFPVLASAVAPGFFDTTFNSPNGFATYLTPYMYGERPGGVAIQSDGKIVVVDTHAYNRNEAQIAVIRYNPDGSLDSDFSSTQGITLYNSAYLSFATDVAIQRDGKIVVAGFRSADENLYDLILLRYKSNGDIDSTFGINGEVIYTTNIGFDGIDSVASLAIQEDGKILIATQAVANAQNMLLLLRYNPSGTLDTSFNESGIVTFGYYKNGGVETNNIIGRKVKVAPGGNIAVLIKAFAFTAVLQYGVNGNLISQSMPFCGQTGCIVEEPEEPIGALPKGMEVLPDGRIIVVGETGVFPFVMRYMGDGNIDQTFGEGAGVVYFNYRDHFGFSDLTVRSSSVRNMAMQPDGSILMVGSCPMAHDLNVSSDDMDVFLGRYTPEGILDSSFGINGIVTFDGVWRGGVTYYGDLGQAVAVQPDGKIIVTGNMRAIASEPGDHYDMVIMRFIGQPGPDIDVSPIFFDFGEVPKGGAKVQQFNISNIGQSDLTIADIELIGSDSNNFTVDSGTCPIIAPGGICIITVRFTPGSEGLKTVTLRITSNDPYARAAIYWPVEVSLQGTAVAAQASYTLTVSTDGNGSGIVQSKQKGIKCGKNWTDCTETYAAGKEITLYRIVEQEESKFIGWSGACSGVKECKILMDSNKEVKATFRADPTLFMWPKFRDFRNVRIGRVKAAFFVVKNSIKNGRKPLEIGPIGLSQTPSPFQIFENECSGKVLQPRDACVFGVLFEPDVAGEYNAEITIKSNDPATPVTAVHLRGNGLPPPPPKPPRKK